MATYNNIKKIKIGDNTFNLYDSGNSGGTITSVKTTAGTHSAINVTSGAANFNVPTKTSHLTNDSGFITNAGVTGVKGNSESSYRTGQVNLTSANLGAVDKSGDTMTGHLIVPAIRAANTYYGITFGRTTETPVETILYTGIKWIHGKHMPVIHVTGYAYGLSSPVEFKIGFYLYGNPTCEVGWCGVTNMGAWSPEVYLFKYTRSSVEYVAVGFKGPCYFLQLQADLQDEMGKFGNVEVDSNYWSWSFLTTAGTIPTTDGGTTCVQVPYRANILNPLTVNGHTVNSDVPTNAKFTDTVTTVTTAGSGNAITAITASNGAITATKGTTFLTSHQDISGKADKTETVSNVAYDSTNAKITKTINGTTSDVVTVATLKSALGSMPASDVYSWAKASNKPTYTASEVGAATSGHTHSTTLATDTGTSSITLASAGKYKLTAGGNSVIFTMPTIPTVSYPVTSVNSKTGAVSLTYSDVDAAAESHTHTKSEITDFPTSMTPTSHAHGNITNAGDITATAPTIASGDQLVINDHSASKITNGPTFDGSTTTQALTKAGTWATFGTSNLTIGTTASTAAAGNHTHTASIATSTGTNQLTLSAGTKYALTAGGSSFIFTTPSNPSVPTSIGSSTTGISIADHSTGSITGVQSSTTTASKVTVSGSNGSAPTLGTAFSVPNVTAAGSGSFTSGAFSGGSGSFTATVTDGVLSYSHTHTAATHGADSHTHTAPTLGTKFTIPNITSVGSASTWSISASDVTVPIKNTSATTVITSKGHTITDNGHTHTLS